MKENNKNICQLLFYHHFCDNIYHVYSDEMLPLSPESRKEKIWDHEKVMIVKAFEKLMRNYGLFRICQQMIGLDSRGRVKVWIHMNPISHLPWSPGTSEEQMVRDLINILESLPLKDSSIQKPLFSRSSYRNFKELLSELSFDKFNYQSSCIQYSAQNLNIEIDRKVHKRSNNVNKLQKIFNPVLCETSRN